MVIKPEHLLQENYMKTSAVTLSPAITESLFEGMLISVTEMDQSFADNKKSLYKGILEAEGNPILIQESFSGFLGKVKSLIDKFLEAIKRIFARFVTMLHKLVKSDKYIIKNEKKFSKFTADQEFDMDIFVYSITDTNVPVIDVDALMEWKAGANNAYNPSNSEYTDTAATLLQRTETRYNTLKDYSDSKSFDNYRSKVIGHTDGSISASDYAEELFKIFRTGETKKEKATIDAGKVTESLTRFKGYDKAIKAVEDKKKEIERKYNDIKKIVKNWSDSLDNHTGLDLIFGKDANASSASETPDNKKKIDNYAKMFATLMVSRIEQMSSIHATAFAAKMDAVKECMVQDRKLLYGALSRVQKIKGLKENGEYYVDPMYDHSEAEEDEEDYYDDDVPEYVDTVEYDGDDEEEDDEDYNSGEYWDDEDPDDESGDHEEY